MERMKQHINRRLLCGGASSYF